MACYTKLATKALTSVLLSAVSLSSYAGWQVVKPGAAVPHEPYFQAGAGHYKDNFPSAYAGKSFPKQYAHLGQPVQMYAVSISGSLKENIERIMSRYHWKVVWKAPYDYNFDGRVTGTSLPNVVEKLLQPFPLQAVMYMSNRTLTVTSRTV
jgi:hypothetical protein